MQEKVCHTIFIENQQKINVTAVKEVQKVTSEQIVIILLGDKRLVINGTALKPIAFSKQNAVFSAEGFIGEIKYGAQKSSFIKKILK